MKLNSVIPPLLFRLGVEIDQTPESCWQKFQSWDMLSPVMRLSDVNSQDG